VEYDLAAVWCCVGNATISERDVGELEGAKGQPVVDADLENGFVLFDVVSMEGTECMHSFEDCETDLINLKKLVIKTLFMWGVTIQFISECSYFDL
jgi:hypothetical protein